MDTTPQNCLTCQHSNRTTDGKKVRCFNAADRTRYLTTADVVEVHRWNMTCPSHCFTLKEPRMPLDPPAAHITVGDLHSTAPGSAARASAGKAPLDQIDLRVLADSLPSDSTERSQVVIVLELLGDYQMGGQPLALDAALGTVLALTTPEEVAAVLDYGRKKYAAWNWAKGFQWSVPLGCSARHLLAIHRGVQHDPESGLPHWAHVWCNLMMLGTFSRDYPDGNDFPWKVNQPHGGRA